MSRTVALGDDLDPRSPCVTPCQMKQIDGVWICAGCGRTLQEIRRWSKMSNLEQLHTVAVGRKRLSGKMEIVKPKPTVETKRKR